jgi:transcriptional regulator with XRE-family HTH domain
MDKEDFNKKLGQYIKQTREELNLSQNDVADLMNNNFQNISAYESGKRNPGTYWIHRLCEALKINPTEFYTNFYKNSQD